MTGRSTGRLHSDPAANRIRKQRERDGSGCIVTFGRHCERLVVHFPAHRRPERRDRCVVYSSQSAVDDAADYCRALGPDWRIVTICTPSTIYADLNCDPWVMHRTRPELLLLREGDRGLVS